MAEREMFGPVLYLSACHGGRALRQTPDRMKSLANAARTSPLCIKLQCLPVHLDGQYIILRQLRT